jgi:hypothetical protein
MLQPDDKLPEAPEAPAPWQLEGTGWIVALRLASGSPVRDAFLPRELKGRGRGFVSFLMYVDYQRSGCGPYRELLFIPGTFPFDDGRRHLCISRILVSTWESVVNGRKNWGIPKDRADFEVTYAVGGGREDRIDVSSDGRHLCSLRFEVSPIPVRFPVSTGLMPRTSAVLAQRYQEHTYYYAPEARGRVRPGRVLDWRFDSLLFPDLSDAIVIGAFKAESFQMTFPKARVE